MLLYLSIHMTMMHVEVYIKYDYGKKFNQS